MLMFYTKKNDKKTRQQGQEQQKTGQSSKK